VRRCRECVLRQGGAADGQRRPRHARARLPAGRVRSCCGRRPTRAVSAKQRIAGEFDLIDRYFRPLAGKGSLDLRDDVAVIQSVPGTDLVVTTDMVVEEVDFFPGDPPESVAARALRINLSDLVAKGADPVAFVLALGLGPARDE